MNHFLGRELFAERDVEISDRDLAGPVHIRGQSGMGKSTLIEQIALQRAWRGTGFCFIDPHRQSAEHIFNRIPAARTKDVLSIIPANDDYGIALNLLEKPSNPSDRGVVASEVMRMFHGLSLIRGACARSRFCATPSSHYWSRNRRRFLASEECS